MTAMDFQAYVRAVNANDIQQVVDTWFTPDVCFQSGRFNARGRTEVREILRFLYDGVRVTLRPLAVLRDGDYLFAEIDADHTAAQHRPDYPLGAMRAGETATFRIFLLMKLRDGRICEFRAAEWPANIGTSQPHQLGTA
jgi:limonene-1,2-epoxide hydrolase